MPSADPWICPKCGTPNSTEYCSECLEHEPLRVPAQIAEPGSWFQVLRGGGTTGQGTVWVLWAIVTLLPLALFAVCARR